jgi:hypothetical protein
MGHADFKTTQIYAEYAPSRDEASLVDRAFDAEFALDATAVGLAGDAAVHSATPDRKRRAA